MKLRLSNGFNYAVEFHAHDPRSFGAALRRAAFDYFAHEGRQHAAQLHVQTDRGTWLSAHYPLSNSPFCISFGSVSDAEWSDCLRSNHDGTEFEYQLDALSSWIST